MGQNINHLFHRVEGIFIWNLPLTVGTNGKRFGFKYSLFCTERMSFNHIINYMILCCSELSLVVL